MNKEKTVSNHKVRFNYSNGTWFHTGSLMNAVKPHMIKNIVSCEIVENGKPVKECLTAGACKSMAVIVTMSGERIPYEMITLVNKRVARASDEYAHAVKMANGIVRDIESAIAAENGCR